MSEAVTITPEEQARRARRCCHCGADAQAWQDAINALGEPGIIRLVQDGLPVRAQLKAGIAGNVASGLAASSFYVNDYGNLGLDEMGNDACAVAEAILEECGL